MKRLELNTDGTVDMTLPFRTNFPSAFLKTSLNINMKLYHVLLNVLLFRVFTSDASALTTGSSQAQPVILDTDIYSDIDDVGALAVANVLVNCGLADLRGVTVNTNSRYGALAVSAVNTYFGNGDVPIAAIRPLTNETFFDNYLYSLGEFASKVAYHWPRGVNDTADTPTPVELYRSVLAEAANSSINIISIGFLTNLADLLRSTADDTSRLSGVELISSRVQELIVMGGAYPSGWEFNFGGHDPVSTQYVLSHWPRNVPITFSGLELGANIFSGHQLRSHSPPDSPVLAAYEWYVGRCGTVRESWDPVTALYGILGLDGFAKLGLESPFTYANEYGYNSITSANGSNAWVDDAGVTNQHWLKLADGVKNTSVAWMLGELFAHDPKQSSCFGYEFRLTVQDY